MYLVPSIKSAVVAFTNSQRFINPVNFAAQLALSVFLGKEPTTDFVKLAQLGRDVTLRNY
jgi:hypothetical protein